MYKIIGADGVEYGPVTAEQLRQWIAEGRVAAHTMAQTEGSTEWKPVASIPEFAALIVKPAAPPQVAAGGRAGAEKKIPAGICGILLGWLGIHKFILGYSAAGVLMLLVSIIGGVLTCGIASSVMWIIGLIEGIIYLTKSDEEFVRTYITNQRSWF